MLEHLHFPPFPLAKPSQAHTPPRFYPNSLQLTRAPLASPLAPPRASVLPRNGRQFVKAFESRARRRRRRRRTCSPTGSGCLPPVSACFTNSKRLAGCGPSYTSGKEHFIGICLYPSSLTMLTTKISGTRRELRMRKGTRKGVINRSTA